VIGQRLGQYEITAKLGEGGMGEVYRAIDSRLKREVAIKVLPAAFTADRERLARFEREAQLLAQLQHPHIASIYGLEESDGVRALVMELVAGEDLSELLARGRLPEVRLVDRTPHSLASVEEALSMARRQLWLREGSAKDEQLTRLVRDSISERDGRYAFDWTPSKIGVVTWSPT